MITDTSTVHPTARETIAPKINKINFQDLIDSLIKGFDDFQAMPTHVIYLCLIYPIVIGIGARIYAGYDVLPLIFPLLAGYTIIGPFVATGMYELSRRRENGLNMARMKAFHILQRHASRSIGVLGIFLTTIYLIWLNVALNIWENNFGGDIPASLSEFFFQVFFTPAGRNLIAIGSFAGFLFAAAVLCLSVVSFPMLMDQDVSIKIAVTTSIKAVLKNPITMAAWGALVICTLFIGALPVFVGLCIALPVLGHATWQLYRKVVAYD